MTLSEIPASGWVLPGVLALAAVVGPAAYLRGRSGAGRAGAGSWERGEERRRRKEAVYGAASYVLLFCCAAVAAALSFHGLVGFGRQNLRLSGGWEYLVPFGLDGAAMFCSVLAVREASHGDAALGSRLLVWLFAAASAWFNWVHAPRGHGHAGAPQFFAGMSLSAAVLFDRALKQTRRAALRDQGLVPRPLPQIRIVRWLRAPRETYSAWSLMLLEGVRTLDEAVDEVREDRRERAEARNRARAADRRERAELKAISRQGRRWPPGRAARHVEMSALPPTGERLGAEPAVAGASAPAPLAAARGDSGAMPTAAARADGPARTADRTGERASGAPAADLTTGDDTLALPRLDSLERKLRDLERQWG